MRTIAIIGAGFCGAVTAVQLLRRSTEPLRVLLINRSGAMARGLAYGTRTDAHVLNVPAARMSALADDEDSFLRYAQARDPSVTAASFVSRSLFGDYLEDLLAQAARTATGGSSLQIMVGDVQRIALDGPEPALLLSDGRRLSVQCVVLALGNFMPADLPANLPANLPVSERCRSFHDGPRYIRDPWAADALANIRPDEPVLLLGTGLTMLDTLLSLRGMGHRAALHALSRRGLLPQAHRDLDHSPAYDADLPALLLQAPDLRRWLRLLRQQAATTPSDWRDVIGALRSATPTLWRALSDAQRARFVRHLRAHWDTHRHRCAPAPGALLESERRSGGLQLLKGRVLGYTPEADAVQVHWRPRGRADTRSQRWARVINCTGPSSDLGRLQEPLIADLLAAGRLCADPLRLGLLVDDQYRLLDHAGRASPGLHYVGPLLRAQYWEATAVPELRTHIQALTTVLLQE